MPKEEAESNGESGLDGSKRVECCHDGGGIALE